MRVGDHRAESAVNVLCADAESSKDAEEAERGNESEANEAGFEGLEEETLSLLHGGRPEGAELSELRPEFLHVGIVLRRDGPEAHRCSSKRQRRPRS